MRRILLIGLLSLLLAAPAGAEEEWTGAQIFTEMTSRHLAPYEAEAMEITTVDRAGNRVIHRVRRHSRLDREGGFRHLLVFDAPPAVRGTALLTFQHPNREDEQWLYLPAFGAEMKPVAAGGVRNTFAGTDYAYEDLVVHTADKYAYERRADEEIDGVAHFVLDSSPRGEALAKASGYGFRRLFVKKDIFFITRTDYFDKRGRLVKRQTVSDLVNLGGRLWRADSWTMENLRQDHRTLVRVLSREHTETAVPEEMFREDYVTSGRHVR